MRRLDTGIPGVTESHLEDEHTPEITDPPILPLDVDRGSNATFGQLG